MVMNLLQNNNNNTMKKKINKRKHMKTRKKSMDGKWYDSPTSTITSTDNLPYKIAAIGASLLVIYGVVYVVSKAWSKGEA